MPFSYQPDAETVSQQIAQGFVTRRKPKKSPAAALWEPEEGEDTYTGPRYLPPKAYQGNPLVHDLALRYDVENSPPGTIKRRPRHSSIPYVRPKE